jgi:hypothetical protein
MQLDEPAWEDKTTSLRLDDDTEVTPTEKGPEPTTRTGQETPRTMDTEAKKGWERRHGVEFPYRLQQRVYEESNWKGTWVLEVKDMTAMDWGIERAPKENGRGYKYVRKPTKQLPFGSLNDANAFPQLEGGQDDLLAWAGRP